MKKLIALFVIASALTGCAANHKNGDCITAVGGTCVLTYMDGESVPSGDVDMRYTGLVKSGNEISGTVSTKTKSW